MGAELGFARGRNANAAVEEGNGKGEEGAQSKTNLSRGFRVPGLVRASLDWRRAAPRRRSLILTAIWLQNHI